MLILQECHFIKAQPPHFKAAPLLLPGKDLGIVLVVSYSVGVLTNGKNEKFLGILLREMFPIMSQRLYRWFPYQMGKK